MYMALKDNFPRMIIEGNDHVDRAAVDSEYRQLVTELRKTYLEHRDGLKE